LAELAEQDDHSGVAVWRRVTDAIGQLPKTTPSGPCTDQYDDATLTLPVRRSAATLAACVVLPISPSAREYRSASVKHEFQLTHPCPSTRLTSGACPGWVKDHIVPLVCGGPDAPSNMQWQAIREAKAKDKWERTTCGR